MKYLTMKDESSDCLCLNENNNELKGAFTRRRYVECVALCDHIGARSEEITSVKCGDRFYLLDIRPDGFWRVMLAYNHKEHKGYSFY